ncbi:MAG: 23S rRNA (guanosine(2251)-2'-O)-methyltransferase RlmB [Eubacteriales bacterium]|nr:23S rRNA (guanosine(2251)-2'-O)-methyltransferase RlmB [Eubacteriales bacterium]
MRRKRQSSSSYQPGRSGSGRREASDGQRGRREGSGSYGYGRGSKDRRGYESGSRGSRGGRGYGSDNRDRGFGHGEGSSSRQSGFIPENVIAGRNPVMEALKSGRNIEKIYVIPGATGSITKIAALAKDRGIVVEKADREKIDRLTGDMNDQGVAAVVSAAKYAEVEDILENAKSKGEAPFVIVLDGIEDPQNLGSIIRSAECVGAHGVIIPKNRAAGLTAAVDRASVGALEYIPVAKVVNVAQTLEKLKEEGLWIYACDFGGENYTDVDLTSPATFVIGAEGKGVSRLVREKSDFVISLPMRGKIQSLNAANAATAIMYEVRRQRG